MYCKKCGTEIKENERFCGKCGAPIKEPIQEINQSFSPEPIVDGSLVMNFIVLSAMQLLILIFRFVSFGKYSVTVKELGISDGGSYSLNKLMGSSVETAIFVIIMLTSIALCILPILKNNLQKRRRLIFSKIIVFWHAITIGISIWELADVVARNKESISNNYGESFFSGSWSLTFGGWLNVIITIATIVFMFVVSSKTKIYKKQ